MIEDMIGHKKDSQKDSLTTYERLPDLQEAYPLMLTKVEVCRLVCFSKVRPHILDVYMIN
jgi:hypothetical protein